MNYHKFKLIIKKAWSKITHPPQEDLTVGIGKVESSYEHHSLYPFIHEFGTERYCTPHALCLEFGLERGILSGVVSGRVPIYKGWKRNTSQDGTILEKQLIK